MYPLIALDKLHTLKQFESGCSLLSSLFPVRILGFILLLWSRSLSFKNLKKRYLHKIDKSEAYLRACVTEKFGAFLAERLSGASRQGIGVWIQGSGRRFMCTVRRMRPKNFQECGVVLG